MVETDFSKRVAKTIKDGFYGSVVLRISDRFSLGIPDILAAIPVTQRSGEGPPTVWFVAIEAKQLRPLMTDPFHKGRRTGAMLKHNFMGPQISMLKKLKDCGADAFGLVRASSDIAFRIEPYDIPAKTGNFTHEELMEFGKPVYRENGIWNFWSTEYGKILSPRHRDNP